MITVSFYVEGSRELGLGHLSRSIPICHELLENGYKVNFLFYGDILGEALLDMHQTQYLSINKNTNLNVEGILSTDIWIIDATKLHTDNIEHVLVKSKKKLLISPVFDLTKCHIIDCCIIRSDPNNLPIKKKIISPSYFESNRATYFIPKGKNRLGIVLSGADSAESINFLLDHLLNNKRLCSVLYEIKVFVGLNGTFIIDRKKKHSYYPQIQLISTLDSLWNIIDEIDYMIIGNGIIVDECEKNNIPYSIFDISSCSENKSSLSNEKVYCSDEIIDLVYETTKYITKIRNSKFTNSPMVEKISWLIKQ